ncbi:MAG: alanine--tRNA ligase [Chloroflexi bacterium]|nr:alanine--tRNA ligase [Chloroflexota bacterium]
MQSSEIRQRFLDFFQGQGHLLVPSSSLIPAGDPTLLLTTAGMVQFKPYFTGEMEPPRRRLTSVQKCFRVTDVESVGDSSHLTLFEMLGNFSIGDYFKHEAIDFAWEFITGNLKLPKERLWTTVFLDDDEALELWARKGVPRERIRRLGEKDNFWGPAGDEGPCGPCSEIHYDNGGPCRLGKPDDQCGPDCSCGRFLEIWNLVFMQFYQDRARKRTPLPRPNIDTGMGLERITRVMQGAASVYDTDIFQPIIARVCELAHKRYGQDGGTDIAIRVVAEHARSAAFLIADGVVPGNAGRGYVLRRLIRRAILFGNKLGLAYDAANADSFLAAVAEVVIQHLGGVYPELAQGRTFIVRVLQQEEAQFARTIETGLPLLEEKLIPLHKEVGRLAMGKQAESPFRIPSTGGSIRIPSSETVSVAGILDALTAPLLEIQTSAEAVEFSKRISGLEAFMLYDTYGFPVEVTAEVAREHGLSVDMEGFNKEMEAQRERARAASGFGGDFERLRVYQELGAGHTAFLGYDTTHATSEVVAIIVNGERANAAGQGQEAEVVLRETPFYAEGGGQAGDGGRLESPRGLFQVEDTQSPVAGLIVHRGKVASGVIAAGDQVAATTPRATTRPPTCCTRRCAPSWAATCASRGRW